jgi:hypothetical protein
MRAFLGTCFIAFAAPAPRVERLSLAAAVLALAVTFPLEALAQEVTLRWIARDFPTAFVTPYLIAGYTWTDARADITLTSGQVGG